MAAQKKHSQSKKILIIKINAIGDVVMALPMATYLRSEDPSVHITWICGNTPAPLLDFVQIVDKIIKVDEKQLLTGNFLKKFWALLKIWKQIAFTSFDRILIAHFDPRYQLLTLFTRAKEKKSLSIIPGRYHSDEYVRLASGKEGPDQCKAVLPKWNHPLSNDLKELLKYQSNPLIVLAPGGAKNALANDALRRWPIENYVHLAREFISMNYLIALTGAPSDFWVIPYFLEFKIINLIGKTNLTELVSFYQKAHLLITHDSGPLHLAKLAGVPTIALFGPTIPSEKIGSEKNIKILWKSTSLACCPCYNGKKFPNCPSNQCLKIITPQEVVIAAADLLQATYV